MDNNSSEPPKSVMKDHDPNDDPFAVLSDDSNQLVSPTEYGSGEVSYTPDDDDDEDDDDDDDGNATNNKPEEEEKPKDDNTTTATKQE